MLRWASSGEQEQRMLKLGVSAARTALPPQLKPVNCVCHGNLVPNDAAVGCSFGGLDQRIADVCYLRGVARQQRRQQWRRRWRQRQQHWCIA
jgi:hypothetical protein